MRTLLTLLALPLLLHPAHAVPPKGGLPLTEIEPYEISIGALMSAIEQDDLRAVTFLLDRRVEVNGTEAWSENTPLLQAIEHGRAAIARLLLKRGADVNVQTKHSLVTPLLFAVQTGNPEMVSLLLKNGAKPNVADWRTQTPLMHATQRQQPEVIRLLLARGAAINARDREGNTPLMMAADPVYVAGFTCTGPLTRRLPPNPDIVKMLLAKRPHLNLRNDAGYTALMLAASAKQNAVVTLLEKAGASRDGLREVALALSIESGDPAAVQKTLEDGADPNGCGDSALLSAVGKENLPIVKALLAKGADVNRKSGYYGKTPLMEAVASPEIAKVLLDAGADIHAQDKQGRPLLYFAVGGSGDPEVARMLLRRGLDPNGVFEGLTWMMCAAKWGHPDIIPVLLEFGADIHAKDKAGNTALHHAIMKEDYVSNARRHAALQALLKAGADAHASNRAEETPYFLVNDVKRWKEYRLTEEDDALLQQYKTRSERQN